MVVAGPGAVGKDTLVAEVIAREPDLALSRSWTTRAQRDGEPEDAYVFVDRAAFEAAIERNAFLEWAEYHGNLYGTPMPDLNDPRHLVLVIELQGARQILETFGDRAVMILIEPPSAAEQAKRIRQRGDDESSARRRLQSATEELDDGRELAHHIVVNDDLAQAVDEVRRILASRLPRAEPPA
ncbi:MAG TPA: hypothetical protein VNB24_01720 [Acidimicrobiales bacterium]|nr:hypothetical protein [Acidimicrobiales bacterium]